MKYLKIFTDFARSIEPLDDAERGRLFSAMLSYADCGQVPDLPGNERFVWPTARLHIDREADYLEDRRKCGALGGRPKRAAEKGTEASGKVEKGTESSGKAGKGAETSKDKDKDKDKDNPSSPGGEDGPRPRGPYANVFLTDRELETFRAEYADANEYIRQMGEYLASTGKTYQNYLAALRRWAGRDKANGQLPPGREQTRRSVRQGGELSREDRLERMAKYVRCGNAPGITGEDSS